ncbi:MAG: transposase, partial [Elusimicrobia bacterium]|nr:transposase [Elusimicrobiota bacterium]
LCAPAQILVVQRFGGKANLHVHLHAVVSDGVFALREGLGVTGKLQFIPAPEPSPAEIADLCERLRRSILRRVVRLGAVPGESAREMLSRSHGGFSLDASVCVAADDRPALERLIRYCLRPAISLKRLTYLPEAGLVRYRPPKTRPGEPAVLEWEAVEFLRCFSRIIAPPRLHLIRYAGALGPRHRLRPWITHAARQGVPYQDLLAGALRLPAVLSAVSNTVRKAVSAAARTWAACMRKVFEIDPVLCPSCGGQMRPVAVITDDRELDRILAHLSLPRDFPKTAPARSPPRATAEETQVDPRVELWEGVDEGPQSDWAAA